MVTGNRILHLPTAAVYLAEAEWRAGDEDAADGAADTALEAVKRQRSNHLLLQALADFPAVIARRLDAEADADSTWHELGRALIAQGIHVDARLRAAIELHEFGRCELLVNGVVVKPAINKSFELLAFLASRPDGEAEREELLDALFDGRADNSARAYLRQAILRLREVLPDKDALVVEHGRVHFRDDLAIDSESARFQAGLAEAARLRDEHRLAATLDALTTFDQGEYLPHINSAWVEGRRQELADLASDARHEAAELSFASARYEDARRLQESVLRDDPYRETVWRLSMRIANALGDDDGVISAYRDCERALAEVGAKPAAATRALLERMRR
jgi:DNA-binding SARP family transcriptional activator